MKEEKYKRRFGDRKDARKVRKVDGMHALLLDLKPDRCDADVYINKNIDVTELLKFIKEKNDKDPSLHYTFFHGMTAAIAKVVYNKPILNRFVANRTYYDRNDVKLAFVAKTEFKEDAEEMLALLDVKEDDNLDDIRKSILEKVSMIREKNDSKKDVNNAIDIIGALPKFIRIPVVGIFKWMDKHGWLPMSLINDNIYYSTVLLSNLGSIKCGAIYHNLTNFGTNSILLTMGEIKKEKIITIDGKEEIRDMCEIGINLDERIADGFYFAKCINLLEYIVSNPKVLEGRMDEKIQI